MCTFVFSNKLSNRDKLRGYFEHFVIYFATSVKKFNNTGARKFDSFFHTKLKPITLKSRVGVKSRFGQTYGTLIRP